MRLITAVLCVSAALAGCSEVPENTILWSEVQPLLESCQVVSVFQTHDRWVTLTLEDGREVNSRSPRLDDIVYLADKVKGCETDILVIME